MELDRKDNNIFFLIVVWFCSELNHLKTDCSLTLHEVTYTQIDNILDAQLMPKVSKYKKACSL